MISVRGLPILVSEEEILATIREQVLQQQGREILRKIKRSGNNVMVCCPFHNEGQERKPSCGISVVAKKDHPAGTYHCFACGSTGTFEEFVAGCFGMSEKSWGERWLLNNFITGESFERPDIPMDIGRINILEKKAMPKYISEEELASYRFYHPYMWQRHLTPEVVEKYDVGYQKDYRPPIKKADGTIEYGNPVECLTFPCRDKHGNCLFVSRRSVKNKSFYLPMDIQKPVYGIYELPRGTDTVVICESVFNALTCATWGIPAVALFGTGDDYQYDILSKLPIRHYILGLDPDSAGAKGSYKIKRALRGKGKMLTKLEIPYGKDINDLTYDEFIRLPEKYF